MLFVSQHLVPRNRAGSSAYKPITACVVAGWRGFSLPEPVGKGCIFAEFNYALQALRSSKHAQTAKQASQSSWNSRQQEDTQYRPAFTRMDAADGCADADEHDEDHEDAGQPCIAWHRL